METHRHLWGGRLLPVIALVAVVAVLLFLPVLLLRLEVLIFGTYYVSGVFIDWGLMDNLESIYEAIGIPMW
jgi:hypothetical protein